MKSTMTALVLLLCAVAVSAQDRPFMEDLSYYVENLEMFELNQEDGRAHHVPEKSILLNGTWKFKYAESPAEIPS